MAREYRTRLGEAGIADTIASCDAVVRGGWKRKGGHEGSYGVWLDLSTIEREGMQDVGGKRVDRRIKIAGLAIPLYVWFIVMCCIVFMLCVLIGEIGR